MRRMQEKAAKEEKERQKLEKLDDKYAKKGLVRPLTSKEKKEAGKQAKRDKDAKLVAGFDMDAHVDGIKGGKHKLGGNVVGSTAKMSQKHQDRMGTGGQK